MINSEIPSTPPETPPAAVHAGHRITGAALLALIATLVVTGIWFAFYMLVFLPRGAP